MRLRLAPLAYLTSTALLCACGDDTGAGGGTSGALATGATSGPIETSSSTAISSAAATSGSGGASACATDVAPEEGLVVTDRGAVRGVAIGSVLAYRGIPYAAPPVGALRWQPPEPHACFDGVLAATDWGSQCPQLADNGAGEAVGEEDCLTLNVFTPKEASAAPRPILFWIHGGGYQAGSASNVVAGVNLHDPQHVVERTDVIVVTIQYRLGVLGWLSHPALAAESDVGTTGNYGQLDQIAALAWVQKNAAAFGGDPARVTIYGESAGGASVCSLIASPLAAGLFSGAIMQSGGCVAATREKADAFGAEVFTGAGCATAPDPVACMRALSTEDALRAHPVPVEVAGAQTYSSVVDGYALLAPPRVVIERGEHNHVPWIIGQNSDETSRSVPLPRNATEAQYEAAVTAQLGALAGPVLAQYPAADYPSPWAAFVALTSDAKFVCGARRSARAALGAQTEPIYRYHFTHGIDTPALAPYGAWHGLDAFFVFGNLNLDGYTPTASETALSNAMIDMWSRFAASRDPNGAGAPAWPRYTADDPFLRLDDVIEAGAGIRTAQCDFWDGLGF